MLRKILEKLGLVRKKKRREAIDNGYVSVNVRITREQKEWLKEMKRRGIIGSYSQFFRRMIDMCMRGVVAVQAKEVVQREVSYIVQQPPRQETIQVSAGQVKSTKFNSLRRELLQELRQALRERRAKIDMVS